MSASRFLLDPQSLAGQVPSATFARGLEVLRNQQVLECTLLGVNSREWAIAGTVQGSGYEAYGVSVVVEVTDTGEIAFFDSNCSCPVGHNCKHGVAMTLRAAYKSGGAAPADAARSATGAGRLPGRGQPAARALSPAELQAEQEAQDQARQQRESQQAQQKVSQWLDLFGDDDPEAAPLEGAGTPARADEMEHLVFTLSPAMMGGYPALQLGYGLTRRLRSGAGPS